MRSLALISVLVTVSVTWARPHHPHASSEMINLINKANTTWTVSTLGYSCIAANYLCSIWSPEETLLSQTVVVNVVISVISHLLLLQAGENFHNIDISYVKGLCGTILNGPKLPEV